MTSAKTVGRVMGSLMLVQGVLGATVNFGLLGSTITGPGFLTTAAPNSLRLSLAAILIIAAGALSMVTATTAWPIFRRHSERMALWFFGLSIAGLCLAAVESATTMSMLSLSQEYVKAGGADNATLESAGLIVRYAKYWAHYTHLLVGVGLVLTLYITLFRFALVPRLLAGIGILAVLLQMTGLLLPFFGNRVNFLLLAPMGICHLILAVWLIVNGLAEDNS